MFSNDQYLEVLKNIKLQANLQKISLSRVYCYTAEFDIEIDHTIGIFKVTLFHVVKTKKGNKATGIPLVFTYSFDDLCKNTPQQLMIKFIYGLVGFAFNGKNINFNIHLGQLSYLPSEDVYISTHMVECLDIESVIKLKRIRDEVQISALQETVTLPGNIR